MPQPTNRRTALNRAVLFALTLLAAGLAADRAAADAPAPPLLGKTDCPWGAPDCNRCVEDVVDATHRLRSHGDTLGFRMNGAADVDTFHHWQGIQRFDTHGARFMAVSRSVEDQDVLFVVVEMGSRDGDGKRFRSNRLEPFLTTGVTPPPPEDRIILQVPRLAEFHHAGGMQAMGNILALGVELPDVKSPQDGHVITPGQSKALFYDMSDPRNPRKIDFEIDHSDLADAAGALLLGRLSDNRILVGIGRGDSSQIDFYVSRGTDLETGFDFFYTWDKDDLRSDLSGDDDFGDYQSLNLVTQCDGTLFIVGTHQNTLSQQDFADTFRVDNGTGDEVVLTKVGARHLFCEDFGPQQCNLDAAAGVYLDPEGRLIVYSTEHDNDGPDGSVKMREFRPVPHSGCDNVRDAWVELFADNHFGGRSIMIDYPDRNLRHYQNYDAVEDFGDATSSAVFCLPEGVTYRLWQNHDCNGDHRDLVGTGEFDNTLNDFHDFSFDDETSCSEWIGGPFADAGPDQTIECEGARTAAVVDGTGSSDVNNASLSFLWASTDASFESTIAPITRAHFLPGTATVALTVDNGSASNTDTALLRTEDTLPPSITCPASATVECVAPGGTPASDPGAQAFLNGARAQDLCDVSVAITNGAPAFFPLGGTPVTFTGTDDALHTDSCSSTLTVVDTTGPAIDPAFALSPPILRVPDHTLQTITVGHLATLEACQPDVRIECAVTSSELPEAPSGDGHTQPDMIFDGAAIAGTSSGFRPVATSNGVGSFTLALRAERNAHGVGRTYTVTCRATDASGNPGAARSATVLVPITAKKTKDTLGASVAGATPGLAPAPVTTPGGAPAEPAAPPKRNRRTGRGTR